MQRHFVDLKSLPGDHRGKETAFCESEVCSRKPRRVQAPDLVAAGADPETDEKREIVLRINVAFVDLSCLLEGCMEWGLHKAVGDGRE